MDPELSPLPMPGGTSLLTVVILLYLAGHTVTIAFTFLLQYFDAANRNAVTESTASYLKAFFREWWYCLAVVLLYPTGWLPRLGRPTYETDGGAPVMLVHGYLMNRSSMFALYWRLRRRGYRNVFAINMHPMLGPIPSIAERLAIDIREISATCGGQPVTVVAHSLSGIAMRWLAGQHDDLPLARVVSIASPHHGTRAAVLGISDNAVKMRIGSDFLQALPQSPPVPWQSLYTELDNVIFPSENAAFGDHRSTIEEVGHLSILFANETARRVAEALADVAGVATVPALEDTAGG